MKTPNILIAVPCYRDMMYADTAKSLINLALTLQAHRAHFTIETWGGTDIVGVRNYYAARLLNNPSFSHILFIDNDMDFRAEAVFELLKAEKPFVGLLYPTRSMALDFAYQPHPDAKPGALIRVKSIGMGVTLIAREVLERLKDHVRAYENHRFSTRGIPGPLYGFFDYIDAYSEDISFCQRWADIGGEIYGVTTESVGHIGSHTYRARFANGFK